MILALLAAAGIAWWTWGRGLTRNQLVAAASALVGLWLLLRGDWQLAIGLFLPGIWMLVQGNAIGQRPQDAPPQGQRMTSDEACRVLGIDAATDEAGIRAAHRRLVARVHPDQGGSADLAGRVNLARDILLAELARRYSR